MTEKSLRFLGDCERIHQRAGRGQDLIKDEECEIRNEKSQKREETVAR
jgi:hypothetical protein